MIDHFPYEVSGKRATQPSLSRTASGASNRHRRPEKPRVLRLTLSSILPVLPTGTATAAPVEAIRRRGGCSKGICRFSLTATGTHLARLPRRVPRITLAACAFAVENPVTDFTVRPQPVRNASMPCEEARCLFQLASTASLRLGQRFVSPSCSIVAATAGPAPGAIAIARLLALVESFKALFSTAARTALHPRILAPRIHRRQALWLGTTH